MNRAKVTEEQPIFFNHNLCPSSALSEDTPFFGVFELNADDQKSPGEREGQSPSPVLRTAKGKLYEQKSAPADEVGGHKKFS